LPAVPTTDRTRLVVLFGGRSAEHDVSCISARNVLAAVDPERYDIVPIGITRDGRWIDAAASVAALDGAATALPSPDPQPGAGLDPLPAIAPQGGGQVVVFPLLHGPMGEDGTVQGLLELAGVPYVGPGVLGAAACMDKGLAKDVLAARGLPQAAWLCVREGEARAADALADRVGEALGWPVFVKPANMGSSIGVSRVTDASGLATAVAEALRFDEYVVIEEAVGARCGVRAREIEVAVLGNAAPRASVPGEIEPSHDFYDFDDKYTDGTSGLLIPAPLDSEATGAVQALALAAFTALRVDGMARVDFLYEDPDAGGRGFLVNELNTIPGFTQISMYPKLWEASGLAYPALVDELVRLAVERHDRRARFATVR